MEKIFLVTDSTADIPHDLAQGLNIAVVPLKVHFSDEEYLDGVTITAQQFYEKLVESEDLPTTSQPSPYDFIETYRKQVGDETNAKIISIHLSAALSGTCQSAHLAATTMKEEGVEVAVIDSKKASYSIGIIVVAVAKAIADGKSFAEVVELANHLVTDTQVYFLVDSLTYLHKGGRIGGAAHLIGSMLNIRPILSLSENGEVYPKEKVRGHNKAIAKIFEYFQEYAGDSKIRAGISHAVAEDAALELKARLEETLDVEEFVFTEIGPVIGTHVGPGTLAIMLHKL